MTSNIYVLGEVANACYLSIISNDKMAVNRIDVITTTMGRVGIVPSFPHGYTYFYDSDLLSILQWCKDNLIDVTISVRYNRPFVVFHGYKALR